MVEKPSGLGRTLVMAPHPDDEVLGAGGTIARLAAEGEKVFVAVVTEGKAPHFTSTMVKNVRQEALSAHRLLGVEETFWLGLPAAGLFETPHSKLNASILSVVSKVSPMTLIIPFVGDMHMDHQLTFMSSLVAARPHQSQFPKTILAYETLSETNWNAPYVTPSFVPNVFIDIGDYLSKKLAAMQIFRSQLREPPHERSIEALQALAVLRGATVSRHAAEAFVMVRHLV